ncbi:hypothetical protein FRC03_010352 [Tulasnella sp. 419]|nr:hypothetical protein FRC03_010352 [Tulasnella sp. 419]
MIVKSLLSSIKAPPNVRLLNIELPPTSNSFFNEMWFSSALGRVPMESPFGVLLAHPTVVIDKSGGRRGEWSRFEVSSTAENSPPTGEVEGTPKLVVVDPTPARSVLISLLPSQSLSSIESLEHVILFDDGTSKFPSLLSSLHSLKRLRLSKCLDSKIIRSVLSTLALPQRDHSTNRSRWACLPLEKLELECTNIEIEDLILFISSRLGGSQVSSSLDDILPPVRLQTLAIKDGRANSDPCCRHVPAKYASIVAKMMGRGVTWNNHYYDASKGWQSRSNRGCNPI